MAVAALFVSALALVFTVASFWWLHARRGQLVTYEPITWSGYFDNPSRSVMRWPLVVHNTGATAIVVLSLRLRFDEGGEPMLWEWTFPTVEPQSEERYDAAGPFSVMGRGTRELVACFAGPLPGGVPDPRPYRAHIEARLGHDGAWVSLLDFHVNLGNFRSPRIYITRTNLASYLTAEELREAADELGALRTTWNLDPPTDSST